MTGPAGDPGSLAAAAGDPDWSLWTVILLKPDCLACGLTGPVLAMAGQHVRITEARTLYPTAEQVFGHYADILPLSAELGLDVVAELRRIYLGRQAGIALGYGQDAARRLRAVLGHRDPAVADPGTIRGRFGTDSLAQARSEGRLIDNLIHSSDSADAVPADLARWYGPAAVTLLTPPPDPGAAP
ncbi:MAG: nucleoside-diphosphate kinase [Streptosporangiaceae bacterium]